MRVETLKEKVLEAIEQNSEWIISIGEELWKIPELGFKEFKTAEFCESIYQKINLPYKTGIAVTGSMAFIGNGRPRIGIIGELDSVACPEHPESDSITGAVHACGHNAQIAAMFGVAIGLIESEVLDNLDGSIALMAVPAEEFLEIEYRLTLKKKGKTEFLGGKQEFIGLGALDDIDLVLTSHTQTKYSRDKVVVGGTNNGFIGKMIRYVGREAHAGGEPWKGVNALNAALLGIMGVHAQRETFKEEDYIRFHPIITKGGEIVNNVPSDVRIESYVRGRTIEAIKEADEKVNRALKAGASAVGAKVEINDIPGYLPYEMDETLTELLKSNAVRLVGEENVMEGEHSTGSTDMGDISAIVPSATFGQGGAEGKSHGRDFRIVDEDMAYVLPAEVMAMTVVDLLCDDSKEAREILNSFKPKIKKDEYVDFMHDLLG